MNTSTIKELDLTPQDIVRFWSRVKVGKQYECWLWLGSKTPKGYGKMAIKGVSFYAHRIALWIIMFGGLSTEKAACHRCDTPSCVNPNHLFAGSHSENMMDATRKGRNGKAGLFKHSKVSYGMVKSIRKAKGSQRDIGARFGISQALVSRIRNRRIWKNI